MILLSVTFPDATLLDFALSELKQKIKIRNVLIKEVNLSDSLPVNYPKAPEYTNDTSHYLEGQPHITDGGPIFSSFLETEKVTEVKLGFLTDNENESAAKGILRKFGGYKIKVGH